MPRLASKLMTDWRKEKGLTQGDAADLIGVSQPMLSEYESGKKVPRTLLALKIQDVTGGLVRIETWGEDAPADLSESGEAPRLTTTEQAATGTDGESR